MEELKVGVIGFGGAGRAHVRRLNEIQGVKVTAIYDPKISNILNHNVNIPKEIIIKIQVLITYI